MTRKKRRDSAVQLIDVRDSKTLREVKETLFNELEDVLSRLSEVASRNDLKFFIAKDRDEVVHYIAEVLRRHNAKKVLKTKSLTTEEIDLNAALKEIGAQVIETDLGERVVQLANQRPSHILAPAIHMSRHQIAELIAAKLGVEVGSEPQEIVEVVERDIRRELESVDVGITGANAIVAETGSVIVVTNEGNATLVTSVPKVLIAVAGLEKVVRDWNEALTLLRVLPLSAGGRISSSYVTIYGPRWTGLKGGKSSELHLVLLDNGRRRAASHRWLKEALRCIRCAACFNACPTYRMVGGHVFGGSSYSGPIGILWTTITESPERAAEVSKLCVSCSLCAHECPVEIDIPLSIAWIKASYGKRSGAEVAFSAYELFASLGSKLPRLFNWLSRNKFVRLALERLASIDSRRPLPSFTGGDAFSSLRPKKLAKPERKVVYFLDTYAAYINWRLAEKAIRMLESLNVEVEVPKQAGSGMPLIQYGLWGRAVKVAERNVKLLHGFVSKGYSVICTEPTAAYCLKEAYPKLLVTQEAKEVSEATYEFVSFLYSYGLVERLLKVARCLSGDVFYHYPCHARTSSPDKPAVKLLSSLGLGVKTAEVDYGCCGMAGTWGYRRGVNGYEMSIEIGKRVARYIRATNPSYVVTESSVCAIQLSDVGKFKVKHPIDVLYEAVANEVRERR